MARGNIEKVYPCINLPSIVDYVMYINSILDPRQ